MTVVRQQGNDRGKAEIQQCKQRSRYEAVWVVTVSVLLLHTITSLVECQVVDPAGPSITLPQFVDELPDMPRLNGYREEQGVISPAALAIGMFATKWKYHRDLPSSPVFAYGTTRETATVPGPTIHARRGVSTYISWENHLPCKHLFPCDSTIYEATPKSGHGVPTVVHLHGGKTEPASDGHALAWFTEGFVETGPTWQSRVSHYHNVALPGNMWYHDHAMGLTRVNLLAGLLGSYHLHDPSIEDTWHLPSGPKYDRTLMIFDRSFFKNGSVYFYSKGDNPTIHPAWQPEYFGDVIIVNGKAWPYLKVERRKYRFRIVNSSNARFFRFALSNGLSFTQIGSDSNYLSSPVTVTDILLAPSEQADVIVDFSRSPSEEIILTNSAVYPYPSGSPVNEQNGKVLKFIVQRQVRPSVDDSRIPQHLMVLPHPNSLEASHIRYITLLEYESKIFGSPTHLLLNGLPFSAPATETPRAGTTELWHIINLTDDNHPVHVHLADFMVLQRRKVTYPEGLEVCIEQAGYDHCNVWRHTSGQITSPPPSESGWKNVFKMVPGHVTSVLVRFALLSNQPFPFNVSAEPGYSYHCHILDHEDNQMMRPIKILP